MARQAAWVRAALPSPGFYPEISGFFEEVGIFLGFLFQKLNHGIFFGFLRARSSKFRNRFFVKSTNKPFCC